MAGRAPLRIRASPKTGHAGVRNLALGALAALACAGTGGPEPDAVQADDPVREEQRELLSITTPNVARASDDAPGADAAAAALPDADTRGEPGRLLIYSAITGHVRLEERSSYDPADRYRSPAEREAARARALETEIEEEMARQEEIVVEESAAPPAPEPPPFDPASEPLSAPPAPTPRPLPASLFETQEMTIPPGTWGNSVELRVVRRSLDVDGDGKPEELRYLDASSGLLIRSELDRDFDGILDAWVTYENGEATARELDRDGDGERDTWEVFEEGRLSLRTQDRDGDGVRDTFFRYGSEELEEKLSDANNDGRVDRIETFRNRHRSSTEEDRTLDGEMDTWTTYRVVEGREVVATVKRDTRGRGEPDVTEIYETRDGETRLARKEEDVNGDGSPDVVSTYEEGRLVQRAISDEALSPL